MGVATNLSQSNIKLSFLVIGQEWLREVVKSYLSYCLPLFTASTCRTRVQSMACFSEFLASKEPGVQAASITRTLLLEYLSYLQAKISPATAKNHVLNLRNFLEMSHREGWLTTCSEHMLYDDGSLATSSNGEFSCDSQTLEAVQSMRPMNPRTNVMRAKHNAAFVTRSV